MNAYKSALASLLSLMGMMAFAHNRPTLEYIKNVGQWNDAVLYRVNFSRGAIFLEDNGFTYTFCDPNDAALVHDYSQWTQGQQEAFQIHGHSWRFKFQGANDFVQVDGDKAYSHYYNYFIGDDPSRWASNVGIYEAVKYHDIYDGVDIRCYNRKSNFKYDFILDPGIEPSVIKMDFSGPDNMKLVDGKLVIATSIGDFTENAPYAYQLIDDKLVEVACHYVLDGTTISFELPEGYNEGYKLIIDPELIAATLSGTTGNSNYGHTATFDLEGGIYTGCISFGAGYPTTDGAFDEDFNGGAGGWGTDIGVSHLTSDGTDLVWATYVGGGDGDYPHSIVADNTKSLYVYGSTTATDYPTTAGAYDETHNGEADIVVTRISNNGTELIGSTFLGGDANDGRNAYSQNYGDTYRGEIILDQNERPIIASFSLSDNYPTTFGAYQTTNQGEQDAVISKLNPLLTNLEVSTYIGSSSNDSGYGVRSMDNGNLVLAGMAGGDDFPTTAGAYQTGFLGGGSEWMGEADGFVAVFNAAGTSLQASTLYGTIEQDQIFFVDLDSNEDIFVYGQGGVDIPIVGDVYSNPNSKQFISKFNQALTSVELSTQIGTGAGGDFFEFVPIAFLVDHCDNIYISSHGAGAALPLTGDALYDTGSFYLAVLSEDLEDLEFGTKYTNDHVDGGTSRFDKNGTVYQAVCSGGGFGTTPDAWATDQTTGWDIGIFKIDFDVSGVNSSISSSDLAGCAPYEIQFNNFSTGDEFIWDFGDGTTSTEFEPSHLYEEPGLYSVSLIVSDSLSCNLADTSYFDVQISVPQDFQPDFSWVTDCETLGIECTNLTDIDYLDYIWDMGDGTILDDYDANYNYEEPGTYTVSLQAIDNGCEEDEIIEYEVTIYDQVVADIGNDDESGCAPLEVNFTNNSSGQVFTWDFGDGTPPVEGNNIDHIFEEPGTYTVVLTAVGTGDCSGESTAEITVEVTPAPVVIPDFSVLQIDDCEEKLVEVENLSVGENVEYLWEMGDGAFYEGNNPSHNFDEPGTYTITLTITELSCEQDFVLTQEVTVIEALDMELPDDIAICYYVDGVMLQGAELGNDAEYLWSTGETTQNIFVSDPGTYSLEGTTNNCTGYDEIEVVSIPQFAANYTMYACEGTQAQIEVPYNDASSYSWCNGESEQTIYADEPGDYCFQFIDEMGCLQEGSVELIEISADADVFIPNAFTPNNDGINDVFVAVGEEVREYELSVWNRWGDLVFQTEDPTQVWDGGYQGGDHYVQDGLYTYRVVYNGSCSAEKIVKTGHITSFR